MGKAKLGVLLGGAYALGLAILVVAALALPCGTFAFVRPALGHVPQHVDHAAHLARVAVHAGGLGVKALPALLGSQGAAPVHRKVLRFCVRQTDVTGFLQKCVAAEGAQDATRAVLVRTLFGGDEG